MKAVRKSEICPHPPDQSGTAQFFLFSSLSSSSSKKISFPRCLTNAGVVKCVSVENVITAQSRMERAYTYE